MRREHVDDDGRTVVRDDDDDRHENALTDKDLRDAYERGRRDEAVHHKRNWPLTIITALLAIVGLIVLVLAALNGSFQRGGRVIDRQLAIAADEAEPALRNAAGEIRDAASNDPEPATGNEIQTAPPAISAEPAPQPATPEAR